MVKSRTCGAVRPQWRRCLCGCVLSVVPPGIPVELEGFARRKVPPVRRFLNLAKEAVYVLAPSGARVGLAAPCAVACAR